MPFSLSNRKIRITNPDGSGNQVQVFKGKSTSNIGFLILPAMSIEGRYYKQFAKALSEYYLVATTDLRGHGNSTVRPSIKVDFGYKEMIEQDIHSAVFALKAKYPDKRWYLLGHSLGGQMAMLYAARKMSPIEGLVLIGSCSVYYKGWKGASRYSTLFGTQIAGLVGNIIGFYPGKIMGFAGTEARTVMLDWSRQSRTGNYVLANDATDYETALLKLKIDTLSISFENDTLAPENAVENLYLKLKPTSDITHHHLMNSHPLNDNFDHYNWTKKPANIVSLIKDWVEER